MAFHGSCHKKKICTEEGITNKNSGILFLFLNNYKKNRYERFKIKVQRD